MSFSLYMACAARSDVATSYGSEIMACIIMSLAAEVAEVTLSAGVGGAITISGLITISHGLANGLLGRDRSDRCLPRSEQLWIFMPRPPR